ncbi:winged helix-turn-helix domain-containing protein [Paractinoplanes globisporus]|uniref:Winged helix-turn-helix domain-containing protein n=1 Tax=Paractinoplanes globisporus TaxID=113565 RepID=A0ABW6WBM2_9ACTN|nr:winged helix-turn-helix domain-containing protein [Actinoplanes globisporus]
MSNTGPPPAPYRLIAAGLRDEILAGTLPAGAKLPSQHELAARHRVARATVQSALRTLAHDGLITARKGAGHYVAAAFSTDADRCPARVELDAAQLAWLDQLPHPGHELVRVLRCELENTHVGPHAGLGQHAGDTEWWVRWTLVASEINPLRMCPAQRDPGDPAADDNTCLLFDGHVGRHSYGAGYFS